MAAQLERDRAALERENEILSAVEMLRGTTYDFRIEATIDVASLYGADILVAALERLDEKIEPGQREDAVSPSSGVLDETMPPRAQPLS